MMKREKEGVCREREEWRGRKGEGMRRKLREGKEEGVMREERRQDGGGRESNESECAVGRMGEMRIVWSGEGEDGWRGGGGRGGRRRGSRGRKWSE